MVCYSSHQSQNNQCIFYKIQITLPRLPTTSLYLAFLVVIFSFTSPSYLHFASFSSLPLCLVHSAYIHLGCWTMLHMLVTSFKSYSIPINSDAPQQIRCATLRFEVTFLLTIICRISEIWCLFAIDWFFLIDWTVNLSFLAFNFGSFHFDDVLGHDWCIRGPIIILSAYLDSSFSYDHFE